MQILVVGDDRRAVAIGTALQRANLRPTILPYPRATAASLDNLPDTALVFACPHTVCTGHCFVRQLRARGQRLPVLVVTTRRTNETPPQCLAAGADDFLPPPYPTWELLAPRAMESRVGRDAVPGNHAPSWPNPVTDATARVPPNSPLCAGLRPRTADPTESPDRRSSAPQRETSWLCAGLRPRTADPTESPDRRSSAPQRETSPVTPPGTADVESSYVNHCTHCPRRFLKVGGLTLDLVWRVVEWKQRVSDLTRHEFRLLELLLSRPGQVCSRAALLQAIGFANDPGTKTLEVNINRLRDKLDDNDRHELIQTVRGDGYVLRADG